MKKVFIMAAVFAAMTFTGCGNSQKQNAGDADSTGVVASAAKDAGAEIEETLKDMTKQLEAKDGEKFNSALEKTQEKIQELIKTDPEAAKKYLQQLQEYLKTNTEKIKDIAGEKAAAAASLISNAPATQLFESLKSQATEATSTGKDAISKAAEAVEAAKNASEEAKDAAGEAIKEGKAAAEAKAAESIEEGKKKTEKAVENSKKKANEAIDKSVSDIKGKLGL